jgi:hypothetical protein
MQMLCLNLFIKRTLCCWYEQDFCHLGESHSMQLVLVLQQQQQTTTKGVGIPKGLGAQVNTQGSILLGWVFHLNYYVRS